MTQRRSAALAVAVSLFTFTGIPAHASAGDNNSISLTITDQDTASGASASVTSPDVSAKRFHKRTRRSTSRRSRYPSVSRGMTSSPIQSTAVMGRLAVVTSDTAQIVGGRDRYGRVLSTCQKGAYLAISGQTGEQYAVLMIDRSLGFVNKSDVQLLDYQVVTKDSPSAAGDTATLGGQMVQSAETYLGVPYVWGGNGREGIDCSGFVKAVYSQYGIDLPRHSGDQAQVGYDVPKDQVNIWAPGDRMYFACHHSEIDHTAMYIGGGYFIHASAGHGHEVAIDRVDNPYYYGHLVCVRRSRQLLNEPVATASAATPDPAAQAPEPGITTIRGTTRTTTRIAIPEASDNQTVASDPEADQQ